MFSSAFVFLLVVVAMANAQPTATTEPQQVITVTNGELEGQWGPLERCPPGSRAVSFRTRNELATPLFDDTALNTIVLYCNDELATNFTSTPGFSGDFQQIVTCPFGGYLTKFILRVSPSSGSSSSSDKTAANDIRFMCSNGYEINGPGNTGGDWGQESGECLDGICGMETRVQPFDGGLGHYDNTALNDVRFTCC